MSDSPFVWHDLTVPNADTVRDFYSAVLGWQAQEIEMDGYADYAMVSPGAETAAGGVCWARGENQGLPAQWLMYVMVPNLTEAIERVQTNGGKLIQGPRMMGDQGFACIQDPAGAHLAIMGPVS